MHSIPIHCALSGVYCGIHCFLNSISHIFTIILLHQFLLHALEIMRTRSARNSRVRDVQHKHWQVSSFGHTILYILYLSCIQCANAGRRGRSPTKRAQSRVGGKSILNFEARDHRDEHSSVLDRTRRAEHAHHTEQILFVV